MPWSGVKGGGHLSLEELLALCLWSVEDPLPSQIASPLPLENQLERSGTHTEIEEKVLEKIYVHGWREGVSIWYLVMVDIYGQSYWRVGPPYYIDHRPSLVSWTSPDVRPGICNFSSWAFVQTGLAKTRCPKLGNTFWLYGMYQNWVTKCFANNNRSIKLVRWLTGALMMNGHVHSVFHRPMKGGACLSCIARPPSKGRRHGRPRLCQEKNQILHFVTTCTLFLTFCSISTFILNSKNDYDFVEGFT